jgi:hypothetical protein
MISARIAPIVVVLILVGCGSQAPAKYHTVRTTFFWVGEPPTPDNHFIPNTPSVWQNNWSQHYGGLDDPNHRDGYRPAAFVPKENPFYFALPYSDYDADGRLKHNVTKVPWYKKTSLGMSIIKNHWIAVTLNGRTVYGQWEDAGPLGEDDVNYVFGSATPHYQNSGLDLSPAMANFLQLPGEGTTTWHFVDETAVPAGPWKEIVTTSQIDWN